MQQKHFGWILLPVALIVIVVLAFVVSSYQKEAHIATPGKGGRAAVAAVAAARGAASGAGTAGYDAFSKTLLVAIVEARNMPVTNPAETRLQSALTHTVDCLQASREAWQAELDRSWDPAVDGVPQYWTTLHPGLATAAPAASLSADQAREWSTTAADYWLQKALKLAAG